VKSEKFLRLIPYPLSLFTVLLLAVSLLFAAQPVDLEEQVRRIAAELRCPVCQNLSVADSPSELAQQMRGVVLEQLKEGKSPEQIKAYFVSKYGEWVLLAPQPKGFNLLIWLLPFVAVTAGIVLVAFVVRRWARKKPGGQPATVDPALMKRVQREAALERPLAVDPEAEGPHAPLLQQQARLYADLKELEFDYQAGKLSQADYQDLRQLSEIQAANVLKEIEISRRQIAKARKAKPMERPTPGREAARPLFRRGWVLAGAGLFLLLFGLTLGILLSRSLRPRGSEQETITGDFLTGSSKEPQSLLAQGRSAFERQEWAQAIEAFKKALAIDATNPEAHTYMGLILAQAGHSEGALMAFDQALSRDPNFPLALWGKGMLLYRAKGDFSGARQNLEKLASLLPAGKEKEELQQTLAELSSQQGKRVKTKKAAGRAQEIRGVVSIDPKLKAQADGQAVLFIIARLANSPGGSPLAVKRIDRPLFPLPYSLGQENVMMAGVPLSGKVTISARLDKDGNLMTREGDLMGEYKKNPVEVGSEKIDIVLDQVM